MKFRPWLLAIPALMLAGCGGGGGSSSISSGIPGAQLTDSTGHPLGSIPVTSSHAIKGSLTGFTPHDQVAICVNGPQGFQIPAGDGLPACTFRTILNSDKTGQVPSSILTPKLAPGTYTIQIFDLPTRGVPTSKGQETFTVAAPNGSTPDIQTGTETGSSFTPSLTFVPGATIYAAASGLPKSMVVTVYVCAHKTAWKTGDALVDVSGFVANTAPNIPAGSKIARPSALRGTAKSQTTDASGNLAPFPIWANVNAEADQQAFDIVVDTAGNGTYNSTSDILLDQGVGSFAIDSLTRAKNPTNAKLSYDSTGAPRSTFAPGDQVFASLATSAGAGSSGSLGTATIYVCAHKSSWKNGDALADISGPQATSHPTTVPTVNSKPVLSGVAIYPPDLLAGSYDVVIDTTGTGKYDSSNDILDGGSTQSFTVQKTVSNKSWTVMVYMDGDNNLAPDAIKNFEEMEKVTYGNSPQVTVAVQAAFNGPASRYIVAHGVDSTEIHTAPLSNLGVIDFGQQGNLTDFINWAKLTAPADHYALILWDHGSGIHTNAIFKGTTAKPFNICFDSQAGNDSLTVPQMHDAIAAAGGADLVATDTCLMGMIEVAYEMRDTCSVFIGSEDLEPEAGYEYSGFLQALVGNAAMTPRQLGAAIVASNEAFYPSPRPSFTCAAWDESKIAPIAIAANAVANDLLATDTSGNPLVYVKGNQGKVLDTQGTATSIGYKDYFDAYTLFTQLGAAGISDQVTTDCNTATQALVDGLISQYSSAYPGVGGANIWFTGTPNQAQYGQGYSQLKFSHDTNWYQFLQKAFDVQIVDDFPHAYVPGMSVGLSSTISPTSGRLYDWDTQSQNSEFSDGTTKAHDLTDTESNNPVLLTGLDQTGDLNLSVTAYDTINGKQITLSSGSLTLKQVVTNPQPIAIRTYTPPNVNTYYDPQFQITKPADALYLRVIVYTDGKPYSDEWYKTPAGTPTIDPGNTLGPFAFSVNFKTAPYKYVLNSIPANSPYYYYNGPFVYDLGNRVLISFGALSSKTKNALSIVQGYVAHKTIDVSWHTTPPS